MNETTKLVDLGQDQIYCDIVRYTTRCGRYKINLHRAKEYTDLEVCMNARSNGLKIETPGMRYERRYSVTDRPVLG